MCSDLTVLKCDVMQDPLTMWIWIFWINYVKASFICYKVYKMTTYAYNWRHAAEAHPVPSSLGEHYADELGYNQTVDMWHIKGLCHTPSRTQALQLTKSGSKINAFKTQTEHKSGLQTCIHTSCPEVAKTCWKKFIKIHCLKHFVFVYSFVHLFIWLSSAFFVSLLLTPKMITVEIGSELIEKIWFVLFFQLKLLFHYRYFQWGYSHEFFTRLCY